MEARRARRFKFPLNISWICTRSEVSRLTVELSPGMEIRLDLETERYVNEPSYRNGPF